MMNMMLLILYYTILRHFPTQPVPGWKIGYRLRFIACKCIFKKCGTDVIIKRNAYFGTGEFLVIGDNSQLGENCKVEKDVIIGNDVLMGPDVIIFSSSHEFSRLDIPINRQGSKPRSPVEIGNDVWIGTRVVILPGVKIGDHAIIGSNTLVTKDVKPYEFYAGVPVQEIKDRRDEK